MKVQRAIEVPPAQSVVLDLARFSLAIIVVGAHVSQRFFQVGWPVLTDFGIFAVGGFFVLSGFMIRSMRPSDGHDFDARRFLIDRVSRLWSISLLAVVLTVLMDFLSWTSNPDFYEQNWGQNATQPWLRLALNIVLLNQSYGDWPLFSNSPFWSLGYEMGFYGIWAAWLSIRGKAQGWLIFAVVLALFGPHVLALLPFWMLGLALYSVLHRSPAWRLAASMGCVVLLAGLVLGHRLGGGPMQLALAINAELKAAFATVGLPLAHVSAQVGIGAVVFFLLMCPVLMVCRGLEPHLRISPRWVSVARRLGEATFPLYLIHFPLFVLLRAVQAYDPASSLHKCMLVLLACLAAILMVPVGDRLKSTLRMAAFRKEVPRP